MKSCRPRCELARRKVCSGFNESLYAFLQKDMISRAAAFEISPNVEELKMLIKGIDVKSAAIPLNRIL